MKLSKSLWVLVLCLPFCSTKAVAQTTICYNKAIAFIQDRSFTEAIAQLDQCLSSDPNMAMAYFQRGTCQLMLQKPNIALVDFNQALRLDSNITEAYLNRGIAHHALNNLTFSESDFLVFLRRQSNDLRGLYNLAVLSEDMDNYPQAITYYSRYLEQAPDLTIRQLRAMAYAAIDSINLAIKDIDFCLQPNANDTSLWMSKGNIYYDANRFREAIDAYNVILLLYPKHKEALYNRADAYSNLGVFELAILDYQSLLSIGRNEADYHFNIGFCQIQLKQNEAAIMSLNKAIDLEFPDFGLLLTLRGVAYNNLKLQAEACSDWKHALQIGYKEAQKYVDELCGLGK